MLVTKEIVDLFMMDNIGILSFQSFHITFKVILNLRILKSFNEDIKGTTYTKTMQTML
jgi:hypothetical protein